MRNINGPGDFLAWLGGADLKVLAQVPTERHRFVQMALVLLTTAGIGSLSMMFALHNGMHLALALAIIGGIVWGLIILNLDRFLVVTMGHARDLKRLLGMALPRFALAAVISLVVATPITLFVFASDINDQMVQQNAIQSQKDATLVQESGPATQAAALLVKINAQKQILLGHLQGTVSNPEVTYWQGQVTALAPQVTADETAKDTALAAYQCEVDGSGTGCEGASKLQGDGPIAHLKQTEYQQAEQKYDTANSQLAYANQQLAKAKQTALDESGETLQQQQANATAVLPGLEKQYNSLEAEVSKNAAATQNAVDHNDGILAQLQDLSDAGAKDPVLKVAQWVVTLLFFCIEILPVTVKILLTTGPLSIYEQVLKTEEDIVADQSKQRRVVARQDAERVANKQIAIADHMRQLEEDLGKRANTHVAAHMEAILDVALTQWSQQVQAKLGVNLPPGAGSPGPGGHVRVTGSQPRLSITAPQPVFKPTNPQSTGNPGTPGNPEGAGQPGGNGYSGTHPGGGANGNGNNNYAKTVTYFTPPGGGYGLPDDDGDDL
jgi:hypothetical protein